SRIPGTRWCPTAAWASAFACWTAWWPIRTNPDVSEDRSGEVWFYHLERSTLDQVLPELLDRTLQKGWRAQVRISDPGLMDHVDERLWAWRDDAFLAHGRADQPHAERQPIL